MDMMDQIVSRYRILEELGSGGMGVVYKAQDPALGRIVALKMVSESLAEDPSYRERFQREARSASALNHPHVCAVYDIGSHQGRPFLVMEYIEGRTLAAAIGALPESDVRRLGAEVAEALAAAHEAGIVHRDIKPSNLMITEHGHAKILDFGLAKRQPAPGAPPPIEEASAAATRLSEERAFLGTARYMSPEQVRGRFVGPASDVFSLGIVLYELAAGRHPFEAEDRFGLLSAIATQTPIAPSTLRPDLSQDFERVILQMLEKEPQLRPRAAEAALRLRQHRPRTTKPAAERRARRHSVGRATERERLHQCLRAVESGSGMVVCVTGEAGIGKSTLVEDFFEELKSAAPSVTLARGRCLEHLVAGGGFLPFLDALESLLRGADSETVIELMRLLAPTWHAHLTPLASEDPALRARLAASQERFKRELLAFLRELTRSRPLVLLLDDLHWADASTIDLLAFLGGKMDALPVLLLVAYRPAELLLAKHPFVDLQLELQARGLCRELPLQFLTPEDTDRYVKLEYPGHRFPEEFLALVHHRTEGSPLFMVDLLRYLRDQGEIVQGDGAWTLKRPASEVGRQFPPSAPVMIKRKVGLLNQEERRLLVTASVQGAECDSAVIAAAMEKDPADVEECMETLANVHGFLKKVGEREFPDGTPTVVYRFVHVLYQNAFYESLQPTRRRQLSASVAGALLQFHGERRHDVAAELALLLEAARDHRRAAEHFRLAAERNARLFASQEAVVLARRGLKQLQRLPLAAERLQIELELQLVLGPALMAMRGFASPEVQETYARARQLCDQVGETPKTFPALNGLWQYYVMRADFPAAGQLAEQLHSLAGDDLDVLPEAYRALGETAHWRGETDAAQPWLEQALAAYDPEMHRSHAVLYGLDPRVAALSILSWTLWTRGDPDLAREKAREGIDWAQKVSHPFTLALALFAAAGVYFFRREAHQCLETAEQAIHLSTEQGFPFWLGTSSATRGWALAQLGRKEEAIAQLNEAMAIYRATGAKIALPWFHFMLADVLAAGGDAEEALRLVKEAHRHLEKNGDRWWEAEVNRIHGEILLTRYADQAAAEACFRKSMEVARRQTARSWELRGALSLARLLKRQGRKSEAQRVLEPIYQSFTEGLDTGDLRDAKALVDELR